MECEPHWHFKLWIYDLPPSNCSGATRRTDKHFLKENRLLIALCPVSLDTLKVSVPSPP